MRRIQEYIKEVIQEMKKVTWPTYEELKGSTWVVITFAILMAVYVAIIDFALTWLIGKVI
jgi:preprotein translocase subunit SecE